MIAIKQAFDGSRGRYGARKVWHQLRREGRDIHPRDKQTVAKRLARNPASGGAWLISDNRAYPTLELSAADAERLHLVGRVIWQGAEV